MSNKDVVKIRDAIIAAVRALDIDCAVSVGYYVTCGDGIVNAGNVTRNEITIHQPDSRVLLVDDTIAVCALALNILHNKGVELS